MSDPEPTDIQGGLTEEEKRDRVISLAFHGRQDLYDRFCNAIEEVVPPGTTVVLRGSAVTGQRWRDGARSMLMVRERVISTSPWSAAMCCTFST